ncbi:hypothetical protein Hanom_Chr15g01360901 [Helianthus anomalus]
MLLMYSMEQYSCGVLVCVFWNILEGSWIVFSYRIPESLFGIQLQTLKATISNFKGRHSVKRLIGFRFESTVH